jgi:hypothetical protein
MGPARRPCITLTSDFGQGDPWVGIMKAVILAICPRATLVDLTHDIPPQDVLAAQLALESSVAFFAPGAVHLAVVDPGVGSARRGLALGTRDRTFVGPDNGLFTFALAHPGWTAVALEERAYRLPEVSRTFHGRDVFAPAAAYLALGVPLDRLGPPVTDPVRLPVPVARRESGGLVGEVLTWDRFGNLITSVTAEDLGRVAGAPAVEIAGRPLGPPVSAYAEAGEGTPAAIVGSTGRLEVFVKDGSARLSLGLGRGAPVRVWPR